jgi:hypothetical protein
MPLGTSAAIFFGGANDDALVFGDGGTQEGFFFLDLPEGIYFDEIHLKDVKKFWEDKSPITKTTELLSGEASVQSSSPDYERPLNTSFRCRTKIHHTITLLMKKRGEKHTLKIDEYTYPNCMIKDLKELEWANGMFEFEITFVQDTT